MNSLPGLYNDYTHNEDTFLESDCSTTEPYFAEYSNYSDDEDIVPIRCNSTTTNWWDCPSLGIVTLNSSDLIYPNFPHIYNWDLKSFSDDHLEDFLNILSPYVSNNLPFDPIIILSVLYLRTCHSDNRRTIVNNSVILSKGFCDFLIIYMRSTSVDGSLGQYELLDRSKINIELPYSLLNNLWYDLYDRIDVNDFIINVVLEISRLKFTKCEYYKLRESCVFFELSILWLIVNFNKIQAISLSKMTEIFKNFVNNDNLICALPFSFFVEKSIVKGLMHSTYSSRIHFRRPLSDFQRIIKDFIVNVRSINRSDDDTNCKNDKFKNKIPNYRFINLKLFSFFDTYRCMGKIKYRHMCRDTIVVLKTLGLTPFDVITQIPYDQNISPNFKSFRFKVMKNWRDDMKQLLSMEKNDLRFFTKTLKVRNFESNIKNEIGDDKNKDVEEKNKECVICLNAEANVIFLPCKNKVCCMICAKRIYECPFCRSKIDCRLINTGNIYDELQICILTESYSMFGKFFRHIVKNWFSIDID